MCDVSRLLLGAEGVVNEADGGKVKIAREGNRRENKQIVQGIESMVYHPLRWFPSIGLRYLINVS